MCFMVKFDIEYAVRSILYNICLLFNIYLEKSDGGVKIRLQKWKRKSLWVCEVPRS